MQISITYMFRIACPQNYLICCARNPPIIYKNIIYENIMFGVNTSTIGTSQISFRLYEYHKSPKTGSGLLFANILFCWAYFREKVFGWNYMFEKSMGLISGGIL